MFTLSATAAQQIAHAAQASDASGMALRIAARLEPNGNIDYGMGFDDARDGDMKLMLHDVDVVIGLESQELLDQTTLDYVELEPGDFNFIFVDERVRAQEAAQPKGGCGGGSCGSGSCGSTRGSC
jgi:iron-sulfur cluster assembly protein